MILENVKKIELDTKLIENKRTLLNKEEQNLEKELNQLKREKRIFQKEVSNHNANLAKLNKDKIKFKNYIYGSCSRNSRNDCCPQGNSLAFCNSKLHKLYRDNYFKNKSDLNKLIKQKKEKIIKNEIKIKLKKLNLGKKIKAWKLKYASTDKKFNQWSLQKKELLGKKKIFKERENNFLDKIDLYKSLLNSIDSDKVKIQRIKID